MPVCSQAYTSQTVMSGAAPRLGKLDASRSALLLCDIQVWGKCAGRTQRIMLTCMTSSKPEAANETLEAASVAYPDKQRFYARPDACRSGFGKTSRGCRR